MLYVYLYILKTVTCCSLIHKSESILKSIIFGALSIRCLTTFLYDYVANNGSSYATLVTVILPENPGIVVHCDYSPFIQRLLSSSLSPANIVHEDTSNNRCIP